jgi:hypothetical protein
MPNGAGLASTHTCTLNAPSLPPKACDGHILPGPSSHSLLSIAKFCDQGCDIRFSTNVCQVFLDNVLLLEGPRDPTTNLWLLPLCPNPKEPPATGHMPHLGIPHAYQTSTKADLLKYLHAAAFSPVPSTWKAAIANNHFLTWPGLSSKAVTKHLPKSMATTQPRPPGQGPEKQAINPPTRHHQDHHQTCSYCHGPY